MRYCFSLLLCLRLIDKKNICHSNSNKLLLEKSFTHNMPCNYVLTNGPKIGQSCGRLSILGIGRCRRCIVKAGSRDYIKNLSNSDNKCHFCESSTVIKNTNVCKECIITRTIHLETEKMIYGKARCAYIINKDKEEERQCHRMIKDKYCVHHQKIINKRNNKKENMNQCSYIINKGKDGERVCGQNFKSDYCWMHKIITLNRLSKEVNKIATSKNTETREKKIKCNYISGIGTKVMRPCFLNTTNNYKYCTFHLKEKNNKRLATKIISEVIYYTIVLLCIYYIYSNTIVVVEQK